MGSTSGRHRPTIEGVARLAGVTTGAVSIALNGLAGVAVATRARISEAARTLSWRPSLPARALFTGQGGALATRQLLECRARYQLSVVGFEDIPLAAHVRTTLTTMRQNATDWGRAAARSLVALVEGEQRHAVTLTPVIFVERASTRARPVH